MSIELATWPDLPADLLTEVVRLALSEDVHTGDVTTLATVPAGRRAVGTIVSRQAGVVAGLPCAAEVFSQVDRSLAFQPLVREGATVASDTALARIEGAARAILTGERVALNFLQRLCGIATLTSAYVARVHGAGARIVDTRKTTPGLRLLEKYAVRVGGGCNHRMGLYDAVLIKDNHIEAVGDLAEAVARARAPAPHTMTITVECETLAQVDAAIRAGADTLLLDNMDLETMVQSVRQASGRALTEASGGVSLETVAAIAATGVDIISVGAITHSAGSLDISLDLTRSVT